MATVRDTVLAYIQKEILPGRRITYDTSLISLGFTNSLEMVAAKTYLEAHYRIRIPDEVATPEAFDTVESITRLLAKLGVR
ncbi:MAG: phosphopantetheine-binding protein [Anaerolineae bacterium]|jgi:acyl carrier protein|nr:phosphopantetheine-binding protein [Anaerolineae bacterium]